jgi:hypothetical protein
MPASQQVALAFYLLRCQEKMLYIDFLVKGYWKWKAIADMEDGMILCGSSWHHLKQSIMKTRIDHKKKHCLATETSMITIDQNGIVLVVFEPSHQVSTNK